MQDNPAQSLTINLIGFEVDVQSCSNAYWRMSANYVDHTNELKFTTYANSVTSINLGGRRNHDGQKRWQPAVAKPLWFVAVAMKQSIKEDRHGNKF